MLELLYQIMPELFSQAPTVTAVGLGVWYLSKRSGDARLAEATRIVHESRLADSIDALTKKLDMVVQAMENHDGRLNEHDIAIARLEERRR